MGTVVAIGGTNKDITDMKKICKELINQSKKKKPKLLYIPTANNDHIIYSRHVTDFFSKNYGCEVTILLLIHRQPNFDEIRTKILESDIIFVEGGNLVVLLDTWKKYNISKVLIQAYKNGTILSGISAGASCWFEKAYSDSVYGQDYGIVEGLGLINGCICPHYNNVSRKNSFKDEMKKFLEKKDIIIGIEENCAVVIDDNKYKVISEDGKSTAYILNSTAVYPKAIDCRELLTDGSKKNEKRGK